MLVCFHKTDKPVAIKV